MNATIANPDAMARFSTRIGSEKLRDDPFMAARQEPAKPHASARIISKLQNSIDGSGPWIGVHLLDSGDKFIQGGWVLSPLPPTVTVERKGNDEIEEKV